MPIATGSGGAVGVGLGEGSGVTVGTAVDTGFGLARCTGTVVVAAGCPHADSASAPMKQQRTSKPTRGRADRMQAQRTARRMVLLRAA
jgi:hypothetical protein